MAVKNLVVKDNALINASYNLELVEQRLILLSIIEARTTGKGITANDRLTITASSYMNNFHTNRNTAYKALKDACNNLFERQFSFIEKTPKGEKVVRTRWVSQVAYIEQQATVELVFAPNVAPLITMLEKNFTSYELDQVSSLSSKYAVRLYEIIISWRAAGKTPMFSTMELRERLGVMPDEYQKMELFKRKVLDFAVKQINDKTDISITYEQHKEGRKIVGFTFSILHKIGSKDIPLENQSELFAGMTDLEAGTIRVRAEAYIASLIAKGQNVTKAHRLNILKKAVEERWGFEDAAKDNGVKNPENKNAKVVLTEWEKISNGTRFKGKDGTIWVKDSGMLRTEVTNRWIADSQIARLFPMLTVMVEEGI